MAVVASRAASSPPQLDKDSAPHNIEAEQALLGAILIDNEVVARVGHLLCASDFYDPVHAAIYESACEVVRAGKVATPISLRNHFTGFEPIDQGLTVPQYLGRLAVDVTSSLNAPDYAR
ncbi:MAG TPA: DnaB-like helicase N-terminal domain-containing protein, partial [Nitrospiraceae bacterium]|nr:DnaB-like helicase N-terminal domain-containing protein [Nitrospiraceae bacterium]